MKLMSSKRIKNELVNKVEKTGGKTPLLQVVSMLGIFEEAMPDEANKYREIWYNAYWSDMDVQDSVV